MFNLLFSRAGLSLERLRTFCEVADAGSMAKAANGDVVRQSQFSRQIKELEEHFGRKLTVRSGRNVILSAEGRELAALARQILISLEGFHHTGDGAAAEPVVLAAGDSFLRGVVLPRLGEIRERLPRVVMELRNLRGEEIVEALDGGGVDLGVIDDEDSRVGLGSVKLGKVGYRLVSAEGKAGQRSDWRAAMERPFVLMERTKRMEDAARALAEKAGTRLAVAVRCASWHGVAETVATVGGSAFLPSIVGLPGGCAVVEAPKLGLPERVLWLAWSERRGELRKNSSVWRRVLGDVLRV